MNQSLNATKCLTLIVTSSEDDEIIDKEKKEGRTRGERL
jgi:hypothetical protein